MMTTFCAAHLAYLLAILSAFLVDGSQAQNEVGIGDSFLDPLNVSPPTGCTTFIDRPRCRTRIPYKGGLLTVQMCRMEPDPQKFNTQLKHQDKRNARGRIRHFYLTGLEIQNATEQTLVSGLVGKRGKNRGKTYRIDIQSNLTYDGSEFVDLQVQINDGKQKAPKPSTVAEVTIQMGMRFPSVKPKGTTSAHIGKKRRRRERFSKCVRAGLSESLRHGARVWVYQSFQANKTFEG